MKIRRRLPPTDLVRVSILRPGVDTVGVSSPVPDFTPARVLVVDDERSLATLLGTYLTQAGFVPALAHSGPEAVTAVREHAPDLVILDLGLPGLDGVEVCRQIRTFSDCFIIMLTARTHETDKVIGLSVGADDYVTKPFSPGELLARVQAVLRRRRPGRPDAAPAAEATVGVFGALSIDYESREVTLDGDPVDVTRTEFDILAVLSERPNLAWSRQQLIEQVWDSAWVGDEHIVDVHIAHLRRKFGDDANNPRFITTVRGVGYRMGRG